MALVRIRDCGLRLPPAEQSVGARQGAYRMLPCTPETLVPDLGHGEPDQAFSASHIFAMVSNGVAVAHVQLGPRKRFEPHGSLAADRKTDSFGPWACSSVG